MDRCDGDVELMWNRRPRLEHQRGHADGTWLLNAARCASPTACSTKRARPPTWWSTRTGEDEKGRVQMSTFLVEAGARLQRRSEDHGQTGMCVQPPIGVPDCVVPAANLVGKEGGSLLHMMGNPRSSASPSRPCAGHHRRALEEMNQRHDRPLGSSIRDFGQIQRHTGESWARSAMRACCHDTNRCLASRPAPRPRRREALRRRPKEIADAAMQVMGGYGYVAEYHVGAVARRQVARNRRWHAGISPEEHHPRPREDARRHLR